MSSIAEATSKLLNVSTAHISQATCDAAMAKQIPWATTIPAVHGFFVYCHEEREEGGFDDLWLVIQLAVKHGFHYVLFDCDADGLDPVESGLPYNEW